MQVDLPRQPKLLPHPEPWVVGDHLVVTPVGSLAVGGRKGASVGSGVDTLQEFDLGNGLFYVHAIPL